MGLYKVLVLAVKSLASPPPEALQEVAVAPPWALQVEVAAPVLHFPACPELCHAPRGSCCAPPFAAAACAPHLSATGAPPAERLALRDLRRLRRDFERRSFLRRLEAAGLFSLPESTSSALKAK